MSEPQNLQVIPTEALLSRVRELRVQNYRLVQIGATRRTDRLELTYTFDLDRCLANLRLHLPSNEARVPSISGIYWCAFLYENEIHDLFEVQIDGIVVDFHGKLYRTAVKFPFGTRQSPSVEPASGMAPKQKLEEPRTLTKEAQPQPAPAGPT